MKYLLWFPLFVAMSMTTNGFADDLTASDLGQHLEVTSWISKVTLPAGSFSVSVVHIVGGKIVGTLEGGITGPSDDSRGQRVVFMYSPGNEGSKTTLLVGQARATSNSSPNIPLPGTIALPETIGEGDYCLGGRYRKENGVMKISGNNIESLEDGLLLKVTKN